MRLRLRIHRNELPAVTVLWPISDVQAHHTVAKLLENVNGTFPLEGSTWGLEDYCVSIGGYECLHYHKLGDVCKDKDEVVIKPLDYAEVRARTLLGRDQITSDGRHLLDGLPFGRPLLKGLVRPEVTIPPRKRQKLLEAGKDDGRVPEFETEGNTGLGKLLTLANGQQDVEEADSESNDEDFEAEDSKDSGSSVSASDKDTDDTSESGSDSDTDSSDSNDTSDSASDGDTSVSEDSWHGVVSAPQTPKGKTGPNSTPTQMTEGVKSTPRNTQTQTTDGAKPTLKDSHTSKTLLQKGLQHPPQKVDESLGQEHDQAARFVGIPHEGESRTQSRNARRRESKRLRHLKATGVLPQDADMAALRQLDSSESLTTPDGSVTRVSTVVVDAKDDSASSVQVKDMLKKEQQDLLTAIASGGVDVTIRAPKRKHSKIMKGEVDEDDDAPPEELSTKRSMSPTAVKSPMPVEENAHLDPKATAEVGAETLLVPPSVTRRSRLDLASSKRLLFGSLGLRVPRTQQDKEALQDKLATRQNRKATNVEAKKAEVPSHADADPNIETVAQTGTDDEDPEAWRDKIELTAVECCEEGIVLSTPPFPFQQRWDPQQQRGKKRKRATELHSANKERRMNQHVADLENGYVESYDKYNVDGGGDALNYDDEQDDEYWEDGALVGAENENEHDSDAAARQLLEEAARQEAVDDFPAAPNDTSALPLLQENDARKGDFVIYKELCCSSATGWQPQMLTRTAQLQDKGNEGWELLLALRDVVQHTYDDEGKRIYGKFEVESASDDEDEGSSRQRFVQWSELLEPRLLFRRHDTVQDEQDAVVT